MKTSNVHKFYANSLEEVIASVDSIEKSCTESGSSSIGTLWFRGHEYSHYNLDPNIFRKANYKYNGLETYSNNHLREDYRFQHFMARNFDKTDYREPHSVFEWQEVMQHFFSRTRLMDWSENLFCALEFALEAFLIPYKNKEIAEKRHKLQPTLWILRPEMLNSKIYNTLLTDEGTSIINKVLADLDKDSIAKIRRELRRNMEIYFSLEDSTEQNFNGIVSLSALEDLKRSYSGREKEALKMMEINPFFYILLRIYADGVPVKSGTVPPLAIIHPYHSQRIKAQKGVFTVFPYYIPNETDKKIQKMEVGFNPLVMEYMEKCQDCLYEIHLLNPSKIAAQLRRIGYKDSDLYPDSQRAAQDMENMDFSI